MAKNKTPTDTSQQEQSPPEAPTSDVQADETAPPAEPALEQSSLEQPPDEPVSAEHAPEEEQTEPAPAAEQTEEESSGGDLAVAPETSLTSLRGILGPGTVVTADDFSGGQEALDSLLKAGLVVQGSDDGPA